MAIKYVDYTGGPDTVVHIGEESLNAAVVLPWSMVGCKLSIGKIVLSCLGQCRDHLWSTRIRYAPLCNAKLMCS